MESSILKDAIDRILDLAKPTTVEVEQPCSDFLLRVGSKGEITLRDADGGAWKLDAKRKIAAWLVQALRPEIEAGKVVVMI